MGVRAMTMNKRLSEARSKFMTLTFLIAWPQKIQTKMYRPQPETPK